MSLLDLKAVLSRSSLEVVCEKTCSKLDLAGLVGLLQQTQMPPQPELWIGVVEFKPLNQEAYGAAGAFANVMTWACNSTEFRRKAETIAATMDLYVANIEDEEPFVEWTKESTVSEAIEDMLLRAELNPNAIVCGTFHRYPFNEA